MVGRMCLAMFSIVFLILSLISLVSSTCYCVSNSQIFDCSGTENPCGNASSVDTGAQLCCVGSDQCGADSICHFTEQIANTTGYYLGGCTDPTYNDPVCQRHCTDSTTSDIVYNSNTQLWSCCGHSNGDVLCQDPEPDATFQAIPLSDFPGTSSAVTSSTSTSSSSSSSTSSLTSSSPLTSTSSALATGTLTPASASGPVNASQNSSSGLAAGTIAGITIAVVLVGLAIIAGIVFVILRRRRRAAAEADAAATANIPDYFDTPGYRGTSPHVPVEGVSEIYSPKQGHGISMNGPYSPGRPEILHESDSRPIPAQLYGSQPQVSELP